MKKNKKIVFILAGCIVVMLLGVIAAYYLKDRQTFLVEDKNINQYIQSLKASKPISNVQSEKYCSYTHQKYSKGSLGCSINYVFYDAHKDVMTKDFDNEAQKLGWDFKFDNTEGNNKYSDKKYVLSRVYEYRTTTCGLHIFEDNQRYRYEIGCSGPAKAEWYPVRNE